MRVPAFFFMELSFVVPFDDEMLARGYSRVYKYLRLIKVFLEHKWRFQFNMSIEGPFYITFGNREIRIIQHSRSDFVSKIDEQWADLQLTRQWDGL